MQKYNIISKLGEGAFADVFLAEYQNKNVALKIPKDLYDLHKAKKYSNYEVELLQHFSNSKYIVNLIDYEITDNANYIIIELLGDELKIVCDHYYNNYDKIPINVVKNITRQILHGLVELSNQNILHNDLKPENILFVEPLDIIFKQSYRKFIKNVTRIARESYSEAANFNDLQEQKKYINIFLKNNYTVLQEILLINASIKISDFGNAYSEKISLLEPNEFKYSHPTRHYISPEILIGAPFWKESDMWSVGCIVYELLTGEIMFNPYRSNNMGVNNMHLASIIRVFGKFPKKLLKNGAYSKKYFSEAKHRLNYLIQKDSDLGSFLKYYKIKESEIPKIVDFLLPIFELDPKKRINPSDCLKSMWVVC